ncbi:MAG: rod shape-determining protein MreC [Pseudomonadota bacterium]
MARSGSNSSEGRLGLLLLILLSAVLLLTQREDARERRTTPLLASDVQAPVAAWLGKPFRELESAVADVEDGRRALEENKALRAELAQLRFENDRLSAQGARLQRLERLLAVEKTGDIPDARIAARAVSDAASPFVRSLLISAGRNQGVRDGYPVLSEAVLVGHVVSAGNRSARILRLDDLNSRVAVSNDRTRARAILIGSNADLASLGFVANSEQWEVGDRILTSGDGGRLPAGLPVGRVQSISPFQIELDFLSKPIDWVFVLPFDGLADPNDVDVEPMTDDAETDQVSATSAVEEAG